MFSEGIVISGMEGTVIGAVVAGSVVSGSAVVGSVATVVFSVGGAVISGLVVSGTVIGWPQPHSSAARHKNSKITLKIFTLTPAFKVSSFFQ